MTAMMLDRVSKIYDGGFVAVEDVSLAVENGELLVLVGPSGCGKTTILRMIAGLEEPTRGEVWLGGEPAAGLPPQERNVAMVFQHGALYPHRSVRGNLAFPLVIAGIEQPAIDARVDEMAHGLGIAATLERRPARLSGGERQRVAMGRALIRGEPQVLLMDEPLASLDVGLRSGLRAEIAALVRSMRLTTVYVTHDQAEALALADRVAVMRYGTIEDVGPPMRVYQEPATAFTAAFLSSPPISLAWATIWLVNGDRIIIDLGSQHMDLPWANPRSESLTPYHADRVIVGIRPEALSPSQSGQEGPQLRGRVTSLDYLGHEWHAGLELGLRPVDVDAVGPRPRRLAAPRRGPAPGLRARVQGLVRPSRNGAHAEPADLKPGGDHRSAHLLLRLDSPADWAVGQEVGVHIDLQRVQFFDCEGRRIGATPRWPVAGDHPQRLPGRRCRRGQVVLPPFCLRQDPRALPWHARLKDSRRRSVYKSVARTESRASKAWPPGDPRSTLGTGPAAETCQKPIRHALLTYT
jgi:multiple sugar transport system ATP-binding protein